MLQAYRKYADEWYDALALLDCELRSLNRGKLVTLELLSARQAEHEYAYQAALKYSYTALALSLCNPHEELAAHALGFQHAFIDRRKNADNLPKSIKSDS